MDFHYLEDFKKLTVICPPQSYKPKNMTTFRWVFDDIDDEKNFKPRLYLLPDNQLEEIELETDTIKRDTKKCGMLALSLFISEMNARNRFNYFMDSQGKKAYKRFGTHIAQADLTEQDGVNDEPDKAGHFNHHPALGYAYEKRFLTISKL